MSASVILSLQAVQVTGNNTYGRMGFILTFISPGQSKPVLAAGHGIDHGFSFNLCRMTQFLFLLFLLRNVFDTDNDA